MSDRTSFNLHPSRVALRVRPIHPQFVLLGHVFKTCQGHVTQKDDQLWMNSSHAHCNLCNFWLNRQSGVRVELQSDALWLAGGLTLKRGLSSELSCCQRRAVIGWRLYRFRNLANAGNVNKLLPSSFPRISISNLTSFKQRLLLRVTWREAPPKTHARVGGGGGKRKRWIEKLSMNRKILIC